MNAALVYKWSGVVPGREAAGRQLMEDANRFWDKAVADGRVTDSAWYIGGGLGFQLAIVRGEMEALLALAATPELQMLNMRAALINQDLQMGYLITGDAVDPMMDVWTEVAGQLT
ncbi:MAG: hypothetical protein WCA82_16795 [Jiangellales bacterium]